MTKPLTQSEIDGGLKLLVNRGDVYAKCPKCKTTMSPKDYCAYKCPTCGKVKKGDIIFYAADELVLN